MVTLKMETGLTSLKNIMTKLFLKKSKHKQLFITRNMLVRLQDPALDGKHMTNASLMQDSSFMTSGPH